MRRLLIALVCASVSGTEAPRGFVSPGGTPAQFKERLDDGGSTKSFGSKERQGGRGAGGSSRTGAFDAVVVYAFTQVVQVWNKVRFYSCYT